MNAEQVLAYVEMMWPDSTKSLLAQAMHAASAFATLAPSSEVIARAQLLADAREHAYSCIAACDGWTVETLGHNIESAFGMDLTDDECDAIARQVLGVQ